MRKFFAALSLVVMFSFVFTACEFEQGDSSSSSVSVVDPNIEKVDEAYDALTLEGIDGVTSRITLPVKGLHDVVITWESSDTKYITNTGVVTRPSFEEGNKKVTLKATLTLGDVKREKEFLVTVLAEEDPSKVEPSLIERFDYDVDSKLDDYDTWTVTKGGQTGTIVDKVPGNDMPTPKALKAVENATSDTHYERGIEVDGVTVMELMFLQENAGAAVSFEFLHGTNRVFSVAVNRGNKFVYRDSNAQEQSSLGFVSGIWYKLRIEIDVNEHQYQFFYYDYDSGELVEITPEGGVSFPEGLTTVNVFRIRVKNAPEANSATYITDIVVNTLEAFPVEAGENPNRSKGLGDIVGFSDIASILIGEEVPEDEIRVYNRFKNTELLVKDTDYTIEVSGDFDNQVEGEYTLTYTFKLVGVEDDVKVLEKVVTVVRADLPNQIISSDHTVIKDGKFKVTLGFVKEDGKVYYVLVDEGSEAPTAEQIKKGSNYGTVEVVKYDEVEITALNQEFTISVDGVGYDLYLVTSSASGFGDVVSLKKINTYYTILTIEDFNKMVNDSTTGIRYVLGKDIDGRDYEFISNKVTFKGEFDGNGYIVANINYVSTNQAYGIFHQTDGAIIKNVTFENINFETAQRAGIIGVMKGGEVDNVKFVNCHIKSTGDSYGALIARINSKEASITKVAAIDCEVLVVDPIKYAGGLVGYAEIDVTLSDIYVDIKVVEEKEMVGGVVSRVKSGATVNASRVVAFVDLTGAKNVGGIIGKNEGTANLSEVLVSGTILSGNNYAGAIVGNGTANVENVYQYDFTGSQSNGFNGTEVTALDVASLTWWQENMPTFDFENVWDLTDGVITLR